MQKENKKDDWQTGPTVARLKERFKEGAVPLQTDFVDLIDLAEHGRAAVGKSQGQTGPADGLTLSPMNRLELNLVTEGGLKATSEGLAVLAGNGIQINTNGIGVKLKPKDSGLYVDKANGLVMLAQPDSGLERTEKGTYIKANKDKGIEVTSDGVAVKLSANNGLLHDKNGIRVKPNTSKGIAVDSEGISIKDGWGVKFGQGGHLDVKAGKGIKVDADGVHVDYDAVLPKGLIMMYYGSKVPDGWALCDGDNGTPDLRDRFVLGATALTNVGKTNDKKVHGSDIDKISLATTTASKADITIVVEGTALTVEQMPAHAHEYMSVEAYSGKERRCWRTNNTEDPYAYGGYERIESITTGGGQPHTHAVNITQTAHTHDVNVVPPYYILAFIMKV